MSYLTAEHLSYAFVFAAIAFFVMVLYSRRGYNKMYDLESDISGLRTELSYARKELAEANKGREKLMKSIDRLIMRRDDLLACLSAARDDKEKVDCIMRLMGEDK